MNNFGGRIDPASIFNPSSNLKVLDLSQNNFSGPLPDISLFSSSLQQLWVHIAYSSLIIWIWYFNRVCVKLIKLNLY
jgi:Leucine-rich repeat (LRR) protein